MLGRNRSVKGERGGSSFALFGSRRKNDDENDSKILRLRDWVIRMIDD